jgi:ferric-dicitrate binding protein FerR (iron transport regulator)
MEERIKYLLQKYLNNSCTKTEFDELFQYIKQNDAESIIKESMGHEYGLKLVPHKKIFSTTVLSIAASILVIIIAGTALLMTNRQQPQQPLAKRDKHPGNTVMRSTLRSEYKYLLLPDSTQVWLNAASTLDFPKVFDKNKRQVFLKGEAYFDVKHAEDIPFVIYTGNVSTEVLGTAFNIKAYPDLEKITVSVNRGKVKVNYENKQVAMLTKGQQVSIDKKIRKVQEKVVKEDVPSSWQQGKLMYDDYSVADIVSDLQRIYDVNINITSQQVKQMRVSTSFKREYGVESALEILCTLTDTQLNIKNGTYSIDNK